jgi:hypothetical protein
MNPYKLADELDTMLKSVGLSDNRVPTMLRKQQAEIEALKAHPLKELTDAEIQQISHRYHYTYNPDYIGFARAILRKAQEK